ncbi:unnamed protein product [Somion occarium]|uniref:C2H2-type domain-containing protein n=1 Tax=Somion occarium TaxID=3059160 RepID=A0ABP1E5N5_9APHY
MSGSFYADYSRYSGMNVNNPNYIQTPAFGMYYATTADNGAPQHYAHHIPPAVQDPPAVQSPKEPILTQVSVDVHECQYPTATGPCRFSFGTKGITQLSAHLRQAHYINIKSEAKIEGELDTRSKAKIPCLWSTQGGPCGETFTVVKSVASHIITQHIHKTTGASWMWKCPICEDCSSSTESLCKQHMRRIHSINFTR